MIIANQSRPVPSIQDLGIFTKRPSKRNDVLGWYAGQLKPANRVGYGLEMSIGSMPRTTKALNLHNARKDLPNTLTPAHLAIVSRAVRLEEVVTIEARTFSNWTRFTNHSCDAYTDFKGRRVGSTRISVIRATKDVPMGVE